MVSKRVAVWMFDEDVLDDYFYYLFHISAQQDEITLKLEKNLQ